MQWYRWRRLALLPRIDAISPLHAMTVRTRRLAWEADDGGVQRELAASRRWRTQLAHVGIGAGQDLGDVGDYAGEREALEDERQAVGRHGSRPVVDLAVQVRATRLAGVADAGEHLAAADSLTGAHQDAAGLKVCVEGVAPVAELESDVVAERCLRGEVASWRLVQRRNVRQVVASANDPAVGDGVNRFAEGEEALVAGRVAERYAAAIVDPNEVGGKAFKQMRSAVDRDQRSPVFAEAAAAVEVEVWAAVQRWRERYHRAPADRGACPIERERAGLAARRGRPHVEAVNDRDRDPPAVPNHQVQPDCRTLPGRQRAGEALSGAH